jgi:acyl-CoA thioester hydrolase
MMRHVNNAVYLTYLEEGRTGFWEWLFKGNGNFEKINFIMAKVSINYMAPSFYQDYLRVYLRVKALGDKSFTFQYEIRKRDEDNLVVNAESVQVMYDYKKGESYSIPQKMREIFLEKGQ